MEVSERPVHGDRLAESNEILRTVRLIAGEDTNSRILYASGSERFLAPRRLYRYLKSEYPIGLRAQTRHVWRARPPAVDDPKALLVLRRPTGDRAPLSDVDGDLVLPQLLQQLAHQTRT